MANIGPLNAPSDPAAACTAAAQTLNASSTFSLREGGEMPIVGLGGGIFQDAERAFASALEVGYRLIDTAPKYGESEAALGRAWVSSGVPRSELFLTSKVGNVGYAAALQSLEASLAKLQTTYLDLMLMHSAVHQPVAKQPRSKLHAENRLATWKALLEARAAGKVRAIGVCNHSPRQIAQYVPLPAVWQLEYHALRQHPAWLQYAREKGIALQAYGGGGGGWQLWKKDPNLDLLGRAPITAAAKAHARSPHQISLRWQIEQGLCIIPKAATRAHQIENRGLFDFALSDSEAEAIGSLRSEGPLSLYGFRDPDEYL